MKNRHYRMCGSLIAARSLWPVMGCNRVCGQFSHCFGIKSTVVGMLRSLERIISWILDWSNHELAVIEAWGLDHLTTASLI